MLYIADTSNNLIRALNTTSMAVMTLVGVPNMGPGYTPDGPASSTRLSQPYGLALGPDGRKLFWTEAMNNIVRKLDLDSMIVTTVAGMPGQSGDIDGPALGAKFGPNGPRGIALYGWDIFIADSGEGLDLFGTVVAIYGNLTNP